MNELTTANFAEVEKKITAENIEGLMQKFIDALDVDSDNSRNTYKRQIKQFFQYLSETGLINSMNKLTVDDIVKYKHFLSERVSTTTANGYLTAVRKFYAWLEAKRIFPNIAKTVKNFKKDKGHKRDDLSILQVKKILAEVRREKEKGLRDYAIINLMARTGLRDIEVSRAQIKDIRQKGGETVLYIQGKGRSSKSEFVVLTEGSLKPIQEYLQERPSCNSEEPLFTSIANRNKGQAMTTRSISRLVKEVMRKAGITSSKISAHSLRHTAITLAIDNGASLVEAQAMARHSDPKTTMQYFHNKKRIENAAEKRIDF